MLPLNFNHLVHTELGALGGIPLSGPLASDQFLSHGQTGQLFGESVAITACHDPWRSLNTFEFELGILSGVWGSHFLVLSLA